MEFRWSVLALLLLLPSPAFAEDELTVKFYPLGELAQSPQGFHFSDGVSKVVPATNSIQAGGSGTGYFSLPATARASEPRSIAEDLDAISLQYSNDVHGALIDLIVVHIEPDSWEENGGEGSITAINDTLVIRQQAKIHTATAEFLKNLHENTIGGQTLNIELWWLPLDDAGRKQLDQVLAGTEAVAKLNQLSETVGGYHGQLNARNRVLGKLSSGTQVPLIVSRIPVVGQGAVGIQPQVSNAHIGVTAQIKARLQETWEGDGIQLSLMTELTEMKDLTHSEASGGDIDRFQLGRYALEANVVCPPATLTIAGSLSAIGLLDGDQQSTKELTVVVRVSK